MPRDRQAYNDYMRSYMLRRDRIRRIWCLAYLGDRCEWCGKRDDLQIDHRVAAEKSFSISKFPGKKWEVVRQELDKCQILCRRCHAVKTVLHKDNRRNHKRR